MINENSRDKYCMAMKIEGDNIKSIFIHGGDCFDNYDGERGVKGIMKLRYHLLKYFKLYYDYNTVIHINDTAHAKINNANFNKKCVLREFWIQKSQLHKYPFMQNTQCLKSYLKHL